MSNESWLTEDLKKELKSIFLEEYTKSFENLELEEFAKDYIQFIDMLDKANQKVQITPRPDY